MKKRLISLIIIGILSLSSLVACTENTQTSNDNPSSTTSENQDNSKSDKDNSKSDKENAKSDKENAKSDKDNSKEDTQENTENLTKEGTRDISNKTENAIKDAFSEALTKLYNTDYSVPENKNEAKEYARSKFSEEGFEEYIKNLNDYNSEFKSSDLLITNIKEIENENTTYVKAYEVTYNVTITSGKPTAYSDLIGMVVEDKDGKIFINSFNQRNF